MKINKEYSYISLLLCLTGQFFKWKNIRVKKKIFLDIFLREKKMKGICELFANTSHLTNIIPIPICKFWNSQTIPIPICKEVGFTNLFLFLFAGIITIRWSLVNMAIFTYVGHTVGCLALDSGQWEPRAGFCIFTIHKLAA